MQELSGKTHYVITGVAVLFAGGKCVEYSVRAAVKMKKLTPRALEWYMESGEWKGRAGSYDDIRGAADSQERPKRGQVDNIEFAFR